MAALSVIGTILFILLFAVVPKLFRAQVRGNTMATALGHGPDGVSASAGEGLRKMRIEGEIRARIIEAALRDEGLEVQVVSDSGGGLGALAAIYVLIYREVDEDRVQLAVADTAIDGR